MEWLKDNWLMAGLIVGAIGWGGLSSPGYIRQMSAFMAGQERQGVVRAEATEMNASAQLAAKKAEIAEARYSGGCEVVGTLDDPALASNIKENEPIVMGAYAKKFDVKKPNASYYLGRDITVCDCYGTTAITRHDPALKYAVPKEIATTSNRVVMAKACQSKPGMKRPGVVAK